MRLCGDGEDGAGSGCGDQGACASSERGSGGHACGLAHTAGLTFGAAAEGPADDGSDDDSTFDFGFCRFGFAGALDCELIRVERVGFAAEPQVGQFEDQLGSAGERAGLFRLDDGSMDRCAAGNDQDIFDDHIFADGEKQRGAFFGLARAHGLIGSYTDESVFEDGDGVVAGAVDR